MPDTLIDSVLLNFFVTSSDPIIPQRNVHLINQFLSSNNNEVKTDLAQRIMIQTIHNLGFETGCIERILQGYITSLLKVDYGFPWIIKDYRSHFLHTVYNYLMGIYLMRQDFLGDMLFPKIDFEMLDNIYLSPSAEPIHSYHEPDYERFQRRWAITAFFHDIAYLPQISYNAMNKEAKHHFHTESQVFSVTIPFFDDIINIPNISEIERHLTRAFIPPFLLYDNALDIISNRLQGRLGKFSSKQIADSVKRVAIKNFIEEYGSHDILGGLEAIKDYYHELRIYLNSLEIDMSYDSIIRIIQEMKDFTDSISNAALHHYDKYKEGIFSPGCKEKISSTSLPLLYLLIIVDELQIWNRDLVSNFTPIAFYDMHVNDTALNDWFQECWKNMLLRFVQSYESKDTLKGMSFEIPYTKDLIKQIKKLEKSGKHDQNTINQIVNKTEYEYSENNGTTLIHFTISPILSQLNEIINVQSSNYELIRIIGILESSWRSFSVNHQTYFLLIELLILFEDMLHQQERIKEEIADKFFYAKIKSDNEEQYLRSNIKNQKLVDQIIHDSHVQSKLKAFRKIFKKQLFNDILLGKYKSFEKHYATSIRSELYIKEKDTTEIFKTISKDIHKALESQANIQINRYLMEFEKLYTQLRTSNQLWIPIDVISFNRIRSIDSGPLEHLKLMYDGKTTQNIQSILERSIEDITKHISIRGINNKVLLAIIDNIRKSFDKHVKKIGGSNESIAL